MKLREIAHSRTGDKGNISVISVIAYHPEDFEYIKSKVTEEAVGEYFKEIVSINSKEMQKRLDWWYFQTCLYNLYKQVF